MQKLIILLNDLSEHIDQFLLHIVVDGAEAGHNVGNIVLAPVFRHPAYTVFCFGLAPYGLLRLFGRIGYGLVNFRVGLEYLALVSKEILEVGQQVVREFIQFEPECPATRGAAV